MSSLPETLAPALGVTRVARVSGLDRTGVEVACAIRPGGHVLQVTNGKGFTFEEAKAGALLEAAELVCAERVEDATLRFGSPEELGARSTVWPLEAPGGSALGIRASYVAATELFSGEEVWVPAQLVFCPPAGAPSLGPQLATWTSNGMGAHPDRALALGHALWELVERDQLGRAAPHGLTPWHFDARRVDPDVVAAQAPSLHRWILELSERRFAVALLDLTPPEPRPETIRLPVAGAVLVDLDEGPVPLTAGYACRPSWPQALTAALLEAAQSRLTEIHGAREDVALGRAQAHALAESLRTPRRHRPRGGEAVGSVEATLRAIAEAGYRRAAAVALPAPAPQLHVFKVLVPGMRTSELL